MRKIGFANLYDANDERIKKSIKKRDDESFVITYELLKDQKQRKINVNDFLQNQYSCTNLIVTEIDNVLTPRPAQAKPEYLYGHRVNKPVKILTQIIIQSMRLLGIEFSIKSTSFITQTRSTALNAFMQSCHQILSNPQANNLFVVNRKCKIKRRK